MYKFRLVPDFWVRRLDAYQIHAIEHPSAVCQYLSAGRTAQTFEEIAGRLQRDSHPGFAPGPGEIAHGLILLLQAGLVELA